MGHFHTGVLKGNWIFRGSGGGVCSGHDLVIGGRFGDTIRAGAGDNIVFGDSARVTAANSNDSRRGAGPLTLLTVGRLETIEPGGGGADTIATGGGHDLVFGGHEGDTIGAGDGNNVVLGDDGAVEYVRVEREGGVPGADTDASDIRGRTRSSGSG